MKRTIFLSMVLCCLLSSQTFCQNYWKYPIVPGTKEWTELKSQEKIIAVQQIPEIILKKMTTEEVYHAWLDLPGRMEILAFNSMQIGFNLVKKRYNVLNELLNRKDAGSVILSKFDKLSPLDLKKEWDSNTKGKFITDFAFDELLLSQPEILESLSKKQKKDLFEKSKKDLGNKINFTGKNKDFFWISSSLVLGCRILEKENIQFKEKIKSKKEIFGSITRGEALNKDEFEKLYEAITENNL